MDKLSEYHAEEDIEDWLEVFECRAACSNVKDDQHQNSVVQERRW